VSSGFSFAEGARLFFTERRVSFATSAIFAVVLSIIGVFALGTFYLISFKNYVEQKLEVAVFLTPEADADLLLSKFVTIEGVVEGQIITSTQALEEFRTELGDDAELLEILDENPLPSSIRLRLAPDYRSLAELDQLERKLMVFAAEGVDEVWIDRNLLSRLNAFLYILLGADGFVLILVGFSAILVTMLATRFAILDRRRTMDIYWLMGVSPGTLRAPFIIEGLFQGFFGSLVAFGIIFALHLIFSPLVGHMKFPALELAGILIGMGLLFGWVGSGLAIDAFKLKRK
jgi:cell division transport system permease protein